MSKKDYTKLAAVVRDTLDSIDFEKDGSDYAAETVKYLTHTLANTLKADNAKFKEQIFFKACGIS